MSKIKQCYIVNEDNQVVSPIVSPESVYCDIDGNVKSLKVILDNIDTFKSGEVRDFRFGTMAIATAPDAMFLSLYTDKKVISINTISAIDTWVIESSSRKTGTSSQVVKAVYAEIKRGNFIFLQVQVKPEYATLQSNGKYVWVEGEVRITFA